MGARIALWIIQSLCSLLMGRGSYPLKDLRLSIRFRVSFMYLATFCSHLTVGSRSCSAICSAWLLGDQALEVIRRANRHKYMPTFQKTLLVPEHPGGLWLGKEVTIESLARRVNTLRDAGVLLSIIVAAMLLILWWKTNEGFFFILFCVLCLYAICLQLNRMIRRTALQP